MLQHYLTDDQSGDHWAVGTNMLGEVLLQTQGMGEQVRVQLTPDQADAIASALSKAALDCRTQGNLLHIPAPALKVQ